jgi:hypothetical protein
MATLSGINGIYTKVLELDGMGPHVGELTRRARGRDRRRFPSCW